MLAPVFQKLLWMSFSAAWLSLAVFALRPLLRKTPRWVVLLLWALVAVRLVCPLSIESRVSLMPRPETVASALQAPAAESAPQPLPMDAMSRVWLAGMGAMLLWGLWGDLRLRRRVRVSMPQGENVRVCDEIRTPFVLGLLRPSIYLPSSLDAAQAGYVLAHERAHIARGDHWWKPLGWVLLSVYWFQPLLWLSYVLFCRDLELACDERVARSLDRAGLAAALQHPARHAGVSHRLRRGRRQSARAGDSALPQTPAPARGAGGARGARHGRHVPDGSARHGAAAAGGAAARAGSGGGVDDPAGRTP